MRVNLQSVRTASITSMIIGVIILTMMKFIRADQHHDVEATESTSSSTSSSSSSATLSSMAVMLLSLSTIISSPFWLPPYIIRIRMWLFTRVNGDTGMQFPNEQFGPESVKRLYASPFARLRSKQSTVGLSDLFWYFLCPGPDIHQEHVESGTRLHEMVNLGTKLMLNVPTERLESLAEKVTRLRFANIPEAKSSAARAVGKGLDTWRVIRLRDFFFPVFARMFYEMLFHEEPTDDTVRLIVASGQNVINALKCTEVRDMKTRNALTKFVMKKLEEGHLADVVAEATGGMTLEERALHVQGVFFHTGCVQMSEAMAHTALAIACHPGVSKKILEDGPDGEYMDLFLTEVLRTWPLFGIAHRINSRDITEPDVHGKPHVIPKGTVMCFNYPKFHSIGYDRPSEFLPERWLSISKKDSNYMPFGSIRNRPCPAQRVALICMAVITRVIVERAQIHSSVTHDRSLPGRGICLVVPNQPFDKAGTGLSGPLGAVRTAAAKHEASGTAAPEGPLAVKTDHKPPMKLMMWSMRARDTVDGLFRSLAQLACGTYMVLDAKRQKLAFTYQQGITPRGPRPDYHTAPATGNLPASPTKIVA